MIEPGTLGGTLLALILGGLVGWTVYGIGCEILARATRKAIQRNWWAQFDRNRVEQDRKTEQRWTRESAYTLTVLERDMPNCEKIGHAIGPCPECGRSSSDTNEPCQRDREQRGEQP